MRNCSVVHDDNRSNFILMEYILIKYCYRNVYGTDSQFIFFNFQNLQFLFGALQRLFYQLIFEFIKTEMVIDHRDTYKKSKNVQK